MAAKHSSKPELVRVIEGVVGDDAVTPHSFLNSASVRAANPFIGVDVVSTLLNVNAVLEFLADAACNREITADEPVTGTGLTNILNALHNALAHQALAMQQPCRMLRKATANG